MRPKYTDKVKILVKWAGGGAGANDGLPAWDSLARVERGAPRHAGNARTRCGQLYEIQVKNWSNAGKQLSILITRQGKEFGGGRVIELDRNEDSVSYQSLNQYLAGQKLINACQILHTDNNSVDLLVKSLGPDREEA